MTLSVKELITEADRCVTCGLCLPHCPTYRKTGSEADSPRGRIQLMRAVAQEILPNNARFNEHIDLCLSCRSCESVCPNNVNYGALLDSSRALLIPKKRISFTLAKPFIRSRQFAKLFTWPLWIAQQTKLDSILKRISPAAKLLPVIEKPMRWQTLYPASTSSKGSVSLFLGCTSSAIDTQTLKAGIYVINKLGYDVLVPRHQTCCGNIARQMGDGKESVNLIEQNRQSFKKELPIISVASGCGAGLQDYLPEHRVEDISTFLTSCDWSKTELDPMNERIFVQDPCTLRNVQKGQQAVYNLLKKIPNVDITPLPGNTQCCGGAGSYILTQSKMATNLRNDKINVIRGNNVAVLVTSNIGCSLHIANGLREQNLAVNVLHPIQIIAKQMGYCV
jgi:glycolate oxidase iron-sulfur subunit